MTNGIGTWFCKAHFDAGWGWDDAVECAMFVYFPVWPLRVVHMQEAARGSFAPEKYQAIPLHWSNQLVRHVFFRRWLTGLVGLGMVLLVTLGLLILWPPKGDAAREWAVIRPILTALAPCLIAGGIVGQFLLRPTARRQRDIRRLLGLHTLGSSDPATWVEQDLARMPKAEAVFGTETYAAAVPRLLMAGAWAGAMWASRLTVALESRSSGEELTAEVLRHPGVEEVLTRFRRDASCWRSAMGVEALVKYQTGQLLAEPQRLFDPLLTEQLARKQTTEQQDQYVAAFGAVFALIGVGVGAWLGSMVSVSIALLGAVLGSIVGAVAGVILGWVVITGR
jgi:hypothetical protein